MGPVHVHERGQLQTFLGATQMPTHTQIQIQTQNPKPKPNVFACLL